MKEGTIRLTLQSDRPLTLEDFARAALHLSELTTAVSEDDAPFHEMDWTLRELTLSDRKTVTLEVQGVQVSRLKRARETLPPSP